MRFVCVLIKLITEDNLIFIFHTRKTNHFVLPVFWHSDETLWPALIFWFEFLNIVVVVVV